MPQSWPLAFGENVRVNPGNYAIKRFEEIEYTEASYSVLERIRKKFTLRRTL